MDSGNSSSMQSSSGGDDQEYDSRSFFPNIAPPPPAPPPPPPPVNNPHLLFNPPDHHPGYLQAFSDRDFFSWPPPSLLRSDSSTHPLNPNQNINYLSFSGEFSAPAAPDTVAAAPQQQQPPPPAAPPGPKAQNPGPSKNPKKRTRASRRAPTTVLTTDTTNFRSMVQEFTGIPDPPFSAAASVYSRRLDLLGTAGSSMRLAAALGGGLLRPTAQRLPTSNNVIQEVISQSGPDPMLAFQTLLQQPHHQQQQQQLLGYQPQPPPLSSNQNATFGINIGLLGSENHLSNTIGSESSSGNLLRMNPHHQQQQQHGGSSTTGNNNDNNNNYVMSCGAMTSSSTTDLIRPQGEYRNQ